MWLVNDSADFILLLSCMMITVTILDIGMPVYFIYKIKVNAKKKIRPKKLGVAKIKL